MAKRIQGGGLAGDSFIATLGGLAAVVVYIFVGMLFLIPGFILFFSQKKKPKEERNKGLQILGIVLMIIGCLIALGMGFGLIIGAIGSMMEE